MKFQNTAPPPAEIPLAPMIDIVFLLLTFFIVTAQINDNEKNLDVKVPTSTEGEERARAMGEIIVNVLKDGTTSVNGQILTPQQLEAKLTNIARVHENQPVRLRGDSDAAYQKIVNVIDLCQKAGIWNVTFAVGSKQ